MENQIYSSVVNIVAIVVAIVGAVLWWHSLSCGEGLGMIVGAVIFLLGALFAIISHWALKNSKKSS